MVRSLLNRFLPVNGYEYILGEKSDFKYQPKKKDKNCRFLENRVGFIILSLGDFDPATGGGF